jgi:hypothetical protein
MKMKCIQAIKKTKEHDLGQILRVDDKTAFNMVGLTWKYVSKSEWKKENGKSKSESSENETQKKPKKNEKVSKKD